jgi:hypothetical protein
MTVQHRRYAATCAPSATSARALLRASLAVLLSAVAVQAGFVKTWTVDEVASAPALVVGRVVRLDRRGNECTATVTVVRSHTRVPGSIRFGYPCAASSNRIVPVFEPNRTYLLPLAYARRWWRLIGEEGHGLEIPVSPRPTVQAGRVSGKGFVLREYENTLLRGTYRELYEFGTYLRFQEQRELGTHLLRRLERSLPAESPRWLNIATALMASTGYPRQRMDADLRRSDGRTPLWMHALGFVPARLRRSAVIRNMLEHSHIHEWGSATTLVPEFQYDPQVVDGLRASLAANKRGAVYIAWCMAQNGQHGLRSEALAAAIPVVRNSAANRNDIFGATNLLLRFGSDEQFQQYLSAIRQAQGAADWRHYRLLWGVWENSFDANTDARIVAIIRIVIADDRIFSGSVRMSDLAAWRLQSLSRESFGYTDWNQPPSERTRALEKARAWLERRR